VHSPLGGRWIADNASRKLYIGDDCHLKAIFHYAMRAWKARPTSSFSADKLRVLLVLPPQRRPLALLQSSNVPSERLL
jgi:hypothetical protein